MSPPARADARRIDAPNVLSVSFLCLSISDRDRMGFVQDGKEIGHHAQKAS